MLKKLIASILIIPFLIVPLICCCSQAQAASLGVGHCDTDSDHSTSAHHEDSKTADHSHAPCDCHSLGTAAEKVATDKIIFLSFQSFFPNVDLVALNRIVFSKGSRSLAYLGPPGKAFTVPLYTLYHSLRI